LSSRFSKPLRLLLTASFASRRTGWTCRLRLFLRLRCRLWPHLLLLWRRCRGLPFLLPAIRLRVNLRLSRRNHTRLRRPLRLRRTLLFPLLRLRLQHLWLRSTPRRRVLDLRLLSLLALRLQLLLPLLLGSDHLLARSITLGLLLLTQHLTLVLCGNWLAHAGARRNVYALV